MSATFFLNGVPKTVSAKLASSLSLNDYLRHHSAPKLSGTKLSCGQGGCGACTVIVAGPDNTTRTVNSCLMPLMSVHGLAVTTSEGLHDKETGKLHPVQERLVQFHGTQCGFCTPGAVMQIYSAISAAQGGSQISLEALEKKDYLAGNICRCTGYRPIHDTLKSFASDTTTRDCLGGGATGPFNPTTAARDLFPEQLRAQPPSPLSVENWQRPNTLEELIAALRHTPDAQIITGHTGHGVYVDMNVLQTGLKAETKIIQLTEVREMLVFEARADRVRFGSSVTINKLISGLEEVVAARGDVSELLLPAVDHLSLIAGHQIRNVASIGGNIMLTRNNGFASDAATVLLALGTDVDYLDVEGQLRSGVPLFDFLKDKQERVVLVSLSFPIRPDSIFKSYRASSRPRNAYSHANAAIRLDLTAFTHVIENAAIFFGAISPLPQRAEKAEALMKGKPLSSLYPSLSPILAAVSSEIVIRDSEHKAYRDKSVQAFIFKFIVGVSEDTGDAAADISAASSLHARGSRHSRSSQVVPRPPENNELSPVFESHPKSTAPAQSSGDARFVDDAPYPAGTLFAAYIQIPAANASFTGINFHEVQDRLGSDFVGVVSSSDIPENIINWCEFMKYGPPVPKEEVPTHHGNEFVFLPPNTPSQYAGQVVGIVVCTSQTIANQAAAAVVLEGLVNASPVFVTPSIECPSHMKEPLKFLRGDENKTEKLFAEYERDEISGSKNRHVIKGRVGKASQSHFYMEPQSSLASPDEDGRFTVNTSAQGTDMTHQVLSKMAGLSQNMINIRFRRVGGGFGGKITRCIPVALHSLLAAQKLNSPVRLVLPRSVDTTIVGGRQEIEGDFTVAVTTKNNTATLDGVKFNLRYSAGASTDFSIINGQIMCQAIDMVYSLENVVINLDVKKTHLPPRTAVRSPGHFEATILVETVIDHVSNALGLEPHLVREANFVRPGAFSMRGLTGGILPPQLVHEWSMNALWERLKVTCEFEKQKAAVVEFNLANKWKKRGIGMTPAKYGLIRFPGMTAKADIFRDGSLTISCGGAEIGQGLHTKVGQAAVATFQKNLPIRLPLSAIRFSDFNTEVLPNANGAGGSTTSEMAMFAVEDAVHKLIAQLKPHVKSAAKSKDGKLVEWTSLVEEAFKGKPFGTTFESSQIGMFRPAVKDIVYDTFGACMSVVEIDCLTGETKILRSDVMFDSGPVINAGLDVGQVEGAFVMGLGQLFLEEVKHDPTTGVCLSKNTWKYKVPTFIDIPEEFNVLLVDFKNDRQSGMWGVTMGTLSATLEMMSVPWKPSKGEPAFKSSKATGEPPLLLAYSAHSAARFAINAANKITSAQSGATAAAVSGVATPHFFPIPLTVDAVSRLIWGDKTDVVELARTIGR